MLEQNTNRMWFLIGVVLSSIALIVFVTEQFPGLFAQSVDETTQQAVTEEVQADPTIQEVSIPYDVEYTTDPDAVRDGQNGMKRVYDDGSEPEIVSGPVNRIRLYPTTSEHIPYETQYRDNPDQPTGWSQVVQEGSDGTKVYYIDPHTDERIEEVPGEGTPVEHRIIEEGSAPIETIDFETEYTLNPDEVRDGKQGRGYTDSDGTQHVMDDPVSEIVLYPTRTESIPYETVERENQNLPEGETQVVQEGENGEKVLHYHPETDEIVKEDVSQKATDRIVEYGTLQSTSVSYDTEYTMNPDDVRDGQNGEKYVYSDGTEEMVSEPVNEIVLYPYHTRAIPHNTVYRTSTSVVGTVTGQQGQSGSKRVYYNPDTGEEVVHEVVRQPQDKVVLEGTIDPAWYTGHWVRVAYNAPYGLAHYSSPAWSASSPYYKGNIPQNQIVGWITGRIRHEGAYQYQVQRPDLSTVYITASDNYMQVGARLEAKVDNVGVYSDSDKTNKTGTLNTGYGFNEVSDLIQNSNGEWVYEIRNTSYRGDTSSYNTTGYVTADTAKVRIEEAPAREYIYTVQSGDSLWAIASKHGVTVNEIEQWNDLPNGNIYAGYPLLLHI